MDQPSPRDSITTAINAAPATSRGPIPCVADRLRSSNLIRTHREFSSIIMRPG